MTHFIIARAHAYIFFLLSLSLSLCPSFSLKARLCSVSKKDNELYANRILFHIHARIKYIDNCKQVKENFFFFSFPFLILHTLESGYYVKL